MVGVRKREVDRAIIRLEKGATYRSQARRLGVNIRTVYRECVNRGKSTRWKIEQRNEKLDEEIVQMSKELCTIPNMVELCRMKKVNFWNLYSKFYVNRGFKVKNVGCYLKARNTCRICGVKLLPDKKKYRLCPKHLGAEKINIIKDDSK
jgi:hypothetical protein